MKRNWVTVGKGSWDGYIISPVGVPSVTLPIACIATDNDKLIYTVPDSYDTCLHRGQIIEADDGTLFAYGLFISFRPWNWDKELKVTEFSHLKVHVNKTYGCFVNTEFGRVYVNTLVGKYMESHDFKSKKYQVVKTQGGNFGYLIPNDGKYK